MSDGHATVDYNGMSIWDVLIHLFKRVINKKNMSKLSKFARKFLGLDVSVHTLVEAGYISEDLKLTDAGKLALHQLSFETHKEALVKMAEEKIAEQEEEAAKK